jgi:peptidoglycan/xylan/chitin deacetylase (PgdA/CDA1 family)
VSRRGVVALVALIALLLVLLRTSQLTTIADQRAVGVALVYTRQDVRPSNEIRAVYEETFRETGIPFRWIASTDISLFRGDALHRMYAAIVFPDGVNLRLPEEAILELTRYASLGGLVVTVSDAGTHTTNGQYRPGSLFAEVSGVDDFLYQTLRAKAFTSGPMQFTDSAEPKRWDVPSGKIINDELSSYQYGPLTYQFPRAEILSNDVVVDAGDGPTPMITRRSVHLGTVAYLALPLGYLRANSDGFPMTLLSTLLTSSSDLPHLVAAPDGIGELILDIHIDSNNEFLGIPNLRHRGLLRRAVHMEFDVTAGPDLDRIGDGLGFDACRTGRKYLGMLLPYGKIGSHGGWAHNLFAKNLEEHRYSVAQVRELVDRNSRCLESITGQKIRSYAAPVGVHPQPMMTNVLDSLGIKGYYYTGDTGAPVERPFFNGKLVSKYSWAFPIVPFGRSASVAEMRRAHIPASAVERWVEQTASYAADRRGIYLIYSHSYDFLAPAYADALGRSLDRLEVMQREGVLRMTDMPSAAAFMDRFVATTSSFIKTRSGVDVHLHNVNGLRSIAFALPSAWLLKNAQLPEGIRQMSTQGNYTIFAVNGDYRDLDLTFVGASS